MTIHASHARQVIWGTCWYYESLETISLFLTNVLTAAKANDITLMPVVFDADHLRSEAERQALSTRLKCVIIPNRIAVYPNKNFGVAAIAELAARTGIDVMTVVDSDWDVSNFNYFLTGLLRPILNEAADIVIPDVSPCAGRDNRLVGRTIVTLSQPRLIDVVATPFPGALAGRSDCVQYLTQSASYHYDWGGEVDILCSAWASGLRITSPYLGMKNVRHRSSHSKAHDAFQMWRAGLEALTPQALAMLSSTGQEQDPYVFKRLGADGLSGLISGTATAQLAKVADYLRDENNDRTIQQLVTMVLAPLSYLVDGSDPTSSLTTPSDDTASPYDPEKLPLVSEIARYAAWEAIITSQLEPSPEFSRRLRSLTGGFLGSWDPEQETAARHAIPDMIAEAHE